MATNALPLLPESKAPKVNIDDQYSTDCRVRRQNILPRRCCLLLRIRRTCHQKGGCNALCVMPSRASPKHEDQPEAGGSWASSPDAFEEAPCVRVSPDYAGGPVHATSL